MAAANSSKRSAGNNSRPLGRGGGSKRGGHLGVVAAAFDLDFDLAPCAAHLRLAEQRHRLEPGTG